MYADGDRLHVAGSRHLLTVVIDKLDERLEKTDWETTAAYGRFTLCSFKKKSPRSLTYQDKVRVRGYSEIKLVKVK